MKGNCGECERRYFCEIDPDKCDEWPDPVPQTNADRIRAMSDEKLAKMLYGADSLGYCKNLPECRELLDTTEGIPEEKCIGCALRWLRQPVEDISEAVSNCGARMDGDGDG